MADYVDVGTGNDLNGWDFHKFVKGPRGTVITGGERHEYPAPDTMFWRPDGMKIDYTVGGIDIHEDKFVDNEHDVISTTITSSSPVVIEFTGRSFYTYQNSITMNATCTFRESDNLVHILEGGTARAKGRARRQAPPQCGHKEKALVPPERARGERGVSKQACSVRQEAPKTQARAPERSRHRARTP